MTELTENKKFFLEKANKIGIITIKTSEKINQFSIEALNELSALLKSIENDPEIDALIFTGTGKAFVAGADIKQMVNMDEKQAEEFAILGQSVFNQVENLNIITIAAINGAAVGGGCELSLACDYRIGAEEARFGQPEINLGAIPGWGGCYRLQKLVGYQQARDMIFTGKLITSQEALEIGLLDKVITSDELLKSAQELAEKLLEKSPLILQYAKKALKAGACMNKHDAFREEQLFFSKSFATEDRKEGMQAFIEKRPPIFTGK